MKRIKLFESYFEDRDKKKYGKFDSDLKNMLWHERTKFEHINTPNPWWSKFIAPKEDIVTELSQEEAQMLHDLCMDAHDHMMKLYKKDPSPGGYGNRKGQAERWKMRAEEILKTKKADQDVMVGIAMEMIDMSSKVIAKWFEPETGDQAAKRAGVIF